MGNNRQKVLDQFFNQETPVQVFPAEVLSVEGATCTVRLLSSGLEVDEVRLYADVDANDGFQPKPRKGSTVLVGCIENDLASLYIAQFTELDGFDYFIDGMQINANKDGFMASTDNTRVWVSTDKAEIRQAGTLLEMQAGRVKLTNGSVSLKDLFSDLATLLNTFIVITPSGPSTALGPNSITALGQLNVKINQLLS